KSTPTVWASAAARVVAAIAASVPTTPVTASPRSRWMWLVWPDAGPATALVSFMLSMSFLHHWVSGGQGAGRDDADDRRVTAWVPQGADAGAAEPEPGVASEDRSGFAVAQLQLHPSTGDDAERVAPLRRDHFDPLATTQRERPHGTTP